MYAQQYQVVGEGAHITVHEPGRGKMRKFVLKHTLVPGDAPEVPHLLSVGLIRPVGGSAAQSLPPPEVPVTSGGEGGPDAGPPENTDEVGAAGSDTDVEARRADARAKLEAAGGKPDGRHGQPVWAEYLVGKGYAYELVAKESKEDLQKLAEQVGNR